jgi:hypothetical protein
MRIQNEQSGSTSLFAQPMAMEAVPEEQGLGIREQGTGNDEAGNREEGTGNSKGGGAEIELMPEAVTGAGIAAPVTIARGVLETRMEAALVSLAEPADAPSATVRQAHLALLERWYYRPEARRTGEIFFADGEGRWPIKGILRGVGRVFASQFKAVASGSSGL